jgi:glyoxylase-like metal-dependent hydrolase (beta-lactamase superfamily II)
LKSRVEIPPLRKLVRTPLFGVFAAVFFLTLVGCGHGDDSSDPQTQAEIRALSDPNWALSTAHALKKDLKSFAVWQLPGQTSKQNESYVILTRNHRVLVVDGGWSGEDAVYLRAFLSTLGSRVNAWFITHPHPDHAGALLDMINDPREMVITRVLASLGPLSEYQGKPGDDRDFAAQFVSAYQQSPLRKIEPVAGDVYTIDGVKIQILSVRNPEITTNALNNSSLVFRMSDDTKSVLFLGDLGREGGDKLLAGPYKALLQSDYVQMAHHGQAGVSKDFYGFVGAITALWPTPQWLWDNDSGKGKGSGPWVTLDVRQWMDDLGIQKNIPSWQGLAEFE